MANKTDSDVFYVSFYVFVAHAYVPHTLVSSSVINTGPQFRVWEYMSHCISLIDLLSQPALVDNPGWNATKQDV